MGYPLTIESQFIPGEDFDDAGKVYGSGATCSENVPDPITLMRNQVEQALIFNGSGLEGDKDSETIMPRNIIFLFEDQNKCAYPIQSLDGIADDFWSMQFYKEL